MSTLYDLADPAMQQTAAGYPQIKTMNTSFLFSQEERDTLRSLAQQVAEIASLPVQNEKAKLWTAHNDLKTLEPLVFIDPENGWNEIILAKELVCRDPLARVWEMQFRKQIYWFRYLKDDKVIEPYFDVPYSYSDNGWGLNIAKHGGENGGAYAVAQALEDYERDLDKLHYPIIEIDHVQSQKAMTLAMELFDGILIVRRKNIWWWTLGMCQEYVNMRGMEDFMCDMIMEPENFHAVMEILCSGQLKRLRWLEKSGLLSLNNDGTYVASGGFGYTNELPQSDFNSSQVRTMDMWGFVDAQETVSVSPEMYAEFVLPYHKRIADRFGMNCYGCCEIYDTRWEYVKTIPRLRKVSVSPWANWRTVPEYLGNKYIASVKPSPTPLASKIMDENEVRNDCRRAAEQTKGGICEFIMKDNNTLGGNPEHAIRWVQIMREEIIKVYG